MEDELISIADLIPDPRNARKHNPRNVGMLEQALKEVGAARSIVIDEFGTILAGNATVEAAGNAGIERVRVIEADGNEIIAVKRTGLSAEQKTKLALYDNRTAELADWDPEEMQRLHRENDKILKSMFSENELRNLELEEVSFMASAELQPRLDQETTTCPECGHVFAR